MARARGIVGVCCVMACLIAAVCAGQQPATQPQIVFDPPKPVVVRQTNGTTARGKLLRITAEEVVIRTLSGTEVALEIERVRSVKTSDGALEYLPSKESYDELAQRFAKPRRAHPQSAAAGKGPIGPNSPEAQPFPFAGRESTDATNKTDPQSPPGRQAPVDSIPPSEGTGETSSAAAASDDRGPSNDGGDELTVLICSQCNKELPSSIRSGDTCPHCGTVVVYDDGAPAAALDLGATGYPDPGATGFPAAPAGPNAPTPAQRPASGTTTVVSDGGLANLSLPLKVGIFVGILALGWLLLQRR